MFEVGFLVGFLRMKNTKLVEKIFLQIDSRLSNFQRIVTDSMTELQLVRQERQLIELQLEQINKSAPAAGGDGKKEEHMKSELFEPQESILSKYSLMMYTSVDDGQFVSLL